MRGTAMTGEKFTLMQYSVHAILGLIDAEDFVIPEIQRPFVWKRSQVRDLIDSLYNGYPTGYIITWKNPDVKTKDGGKANGKKSADRWSATSNRFNGRYIWERSSG